MDSFIRNLFPETIECSNEYLSVLKSAIGEYIQIVLKGVRYPPFYNIPGNVTSFQKFIISLYPFFTKSGQIEEIVAFCREIFNILGGVILTPEGYDLTSVVCLDYGIQLFGKEFLDKCKEEMRYGSIMNYTIMFLIKYGDYTNIFKEYCKSVIFDEKWDKDTKLVEKMFYSVITSKNKDKIYLNLIKYYFEENAEIITETLYQVTLTRAKKLLSKSINTNLHNVSCVDLVLINDHARFEFINQSSRQVRA